MSISLKDRIKFLNQLEHNLIAMQEPLLEALKKDLSKPTVEAYLSEYHFVLQEIRLVCRQLSHWLKPEKVSTPLWFQPAKSWITRDPHGHVLIIAPWNYPIQLALAPLISAVAGGNTVTLKPSELTPASETFLTELFADSFSKSIVKIVTGGPDITSKLLDQTDEKFDLIFFTGSTRVGKIVAQKAAQHLTPTVLELGGKCPCIIDQTINTEKELHATAQRLLIAKLFNAGQTCLAPDYLLVHQDVVAPFTATLQKELHSHPWDSQDELASLIHQSHYDRLLGLLENTSESDIIKKGQDNPSQLRLAPRLIKDVFPHHPLMQEELFGPLLPIITYDDQDHLQQLLKLHPNPLAAYLFSTDKSFQKKLSQQFPAGSYGYNDLIKQATNLKLPFGGVGQSGHGRYRGQHGFHTFTRQTAHLSRPLIKDPFAPLPPRKKLTETIRKWMK